MYITANRAFSRCTADVAGSKFSGRPARFSIFAARRFLLLVFEKSFIGIFRVDGAKG